MQDLKKLNRAELLELLIEQTKENDRLKEQLRVLQDRLLEKRLVCENSGSIAEAAMKLNKVFDAAQAACDQYTENIKLLNAPNAEKDVSERCNKMIEEAKAESAAYWDKVNARVEELMDKSPTLRKLLSDITEASDEKA